MKLLRTLIVTVLLWIYFITTCCAQLPNFFRDVKQGPVDLVILMDRSTAMGRYHFYTNQKVLIHNIIMYHLPVHPDRVRVAVVTFAVDLDVIVDGISGTPVSKCDLFKDNGYWEKVVYKVQYLSTEQGYTLNNTLTDGTYVDLAYAKADEILHAGRYQKSSVKQFVLIATDAGWVNRDPRPARDKLLAKNVQIYIIGTGPWVENRIGNLNSLQIDANAENVKRDHEWKAAVKDQPKLIEEANSALWMDQQDDVCFQDIRQCETVTGLSRCTQNEREGKIDGCLTKPCMNEGSCYEYDVGFQCVCREGFYGRYCEKNLNECSLPGVCNPATVRCEDRINSFWCHCDATCPETYCDCLSGDLTPSAGKDTDDKVVLSTGWLYVVIPVVLYVIIVFVATGYACYRTRKQTKFNRYLTSSKNTATSVVSADTMTTTAASQTYAVPPPHLTASTATTTRVNNDYEAPKEAGATAEPLTITDKLRTLIATSTVPDLIRNNTRRLSRLIVATRKAPEAPPSSAALKSPSLIIPTRKAPDPPTNSVAPNSPTSPKPAIYGNTDQLRDEINATITGRLYKKNTGTVTTAKPRPEISGPIMPPGTYQNDSPRKSTVQHNTLSKSTASQSNAAPRPVLPLKLVTLTRTSSTPTTPTTPITPPTPTVPPVPVKRVTSVKPVISPKPPIARKPSSSIYKNEPNRTSTEDKRIYPKPAGVESSEGEDGDDDWDYGTVWSGTSGLSFESSHAEPAAPTERPDILLENFERKAQAIGSNYSKAPQCQGMLGWLDFVCDLTSEKGQNLDRVCIVQLDGKRWIASDGSLRPDNNTQIGDIYRTLHSKEDGAEIVVGNETKRTFYVEKNDGLVLQAVGGKDGRKDEVLCVGKSRKYLILGGIALEKDCGQCAIEIDYVRAHLKNMGH